MHGPFTPHQHLRVREHLLETMAEYFSLHLRACSNTCNSSVRPECSARSAVLVDGYPEAP